MSVPHRRQRLSAAMADETRVAALRTANNLAEPGHVDVFRAILREGAGASRRSRLNGLSDGRLRRALPLVVLIPALSIFRSSLIRQSVERHSTPRELQGILGRSPAVCFLDPFSQLWYKPLLVTRAQNDLLSGVRLAVAPPNIDAADIPSKRQHPFEGQYFRRSFSGWWLVLLAIVLARSTYVTRQHAVHRAAGAVQSPASRD
jgi:hypothetical protein